MSASASPYQTFPGDLCRIVAGLCDTLHLGESRLSDQVEKIRASLGAPLRIAFAGRVSAGKSTTVNALLAAKLAPVGAGRPRRSSTGSQPARLSKR